MSTFLVAMATSAATTLVVDYALRPRLEARKTRILAVHAHRDEFSSHVLALMVNCSRLKETQDVDQNLELAGLLPERERWRSKIDESTLWLIDNMELYALSYVRAGGIQELLTRYAPAARGVWLSERNEADKIELLLEMSGLVKEYFFPSWWRAAQMPDRKKKLISVLARVGGDPDAPPT